MFGTRQAIPVVGWLSVWFGLHFFFASRLSTPRNRTVSREPNSPEIQIWEHTYVCPHMSSFVVTAAITTLKCLCSSYLLIYALGGAWEGILFFFAVEIYISAGSCGTRKRGGSDLIRIYFSVNSNFPKCVYTWYCSCDRSGAWLGVTRTSKNVSTICVMFFPISHAVGCLVGLMSYWLILKISACKVELGMLLTTSRMAHYTIEKSHDHIERNVFFHVLKILHEKKVLYVTLSLFSDNLYHENSRNFSNRPI